MCMYMYSRYTSPATVGLFRVYIHTDAGIRRIIDVIFVGVHVYVSVSPDTLHQPLPAYLVYIYIIYEYGYL